MKVPPSERGRSQAETAADNRVRTVLSRPIAPADAVVAAVIAVGVLLRAWTLLFFEFKNDQALAVLLGVNTLRFLHDAGGHPHEYGPGYGLLSRWRGDLAEPAAGTPVALTIRTDSSVRPKFDEPAVRFALAAFGTPPETPWYEPRLPLTLDVAWDNAARRYRHRIEPTSGTDQP